jgi:hypothetical protein
MRYSYTNASRTLSINSSVVFCDCLQSRNPLDLSSFSDFLTDCEQLVEKDFTPSKGAIANVRGNWYEWLLSVGYFWYQKKFLNAQKYLLIPIPNVTSLDLYSLYSEDIYKYILDLRQKTSQFDVSLISSNPDFVVINKKILGQLPNLSNLNETELSRIDGFYKNYIGKCNFREITAYASVKTSLRPDRRLQLSHEGALTKAFFQHLKTRLWITEPISLQYFACSMNIGEQDVDALKTVATHSILSVNTIPEPAVDLLKCVSNGEELKSFFDVIFAYKSTN